MPPLPLDHRGGDNTEATVRNVSVSLLREVPEAYRTQINDALLTALAQSLSAWTRSPSVLVNLEGHGREEVFSGVDLTRTVGWFTTLYPVVLEVKRRDAQPGEALMSVKEQLRAIPNRGLGCGLLRYLREDAELGEMPQAEVSFNYLGQLDQALPAAAALTAVREPSGPAHSPRGRRRHALDVLASIAGGRLQARATP